MYSNWCTMNIIIYAFLLKTVHLWIRYRFNQIIIYTFNKTYILISHLLLKSRCNYCSNPYWYAIKTFKLHLKHNFKQLNCKDGYAFLLLHFNITPPANQPVSQRSYVIWPTQKLFQRFKINHSEPVIKTVII